jgi:hypothetical protein
MNHDWLDDALDDLIGFDDASGRWTYEDSLGELVPIDLVNSTEVLLRELGYGPSDFIWEKAKGSKSFVRRGRAVLAGVHGSPGKVTMTALEWFLDEREPAQEVVIFSGWGFSSKTRTFADRLDIALFRYTAIDQVEPFNKTALARVRRQQAARTAPPGTPRLGRY